MRKGVSTPTPLCDRLAAQVDSSGGSESCHPWKAYRNRAGYGRLNDRGVCKLAHRVAWELSYGSIPTGALVCHSCDNPACCNPHHLFLGSHKDNTSDMVSKGRNAAKLDEFSVRYLRAAWSVRRFNKSKLAKRLGVCRHALSRALAGETWSHVC
jgi:hypothetical protein